MIVISPLLQLRPKGKLFVHENFIKHLNFGKCSNNTKFKKNQKY